MVGLRHLMVVSDRSTDGTDQVLTSLALRDARITFIRHEPRAGKTAALSPLLERAPSEIIILADANLMYGPDTVRRLVAPFRVERLIAKAEGFNATERFAGYRC